MKRLRSYYHSSLAPAVYTGACLYSDINPVLTQDGKWCKACTHVEDVRREKVPQRLFGQCCQYVINLSPDIDSPSNVLELHSNRCSHLDYAIPDDHQSVHILPNSRIPADLAQVFDLIIPFFLFHRVISDLLLRR